MKTLSKIFLFLVISTGVHSQTLSPQVIASAGGYFTSGGASLSWTLGETFNTTLSSVNCKLTQGFQQPEISVYIVNAKAFIEGFYNGGGFMRPVINPQTQPFSADTVVLRLARNIPPFDILYSDTSVLQTDGNAKFDFPISTRGISYYFVLKHRNSLETWSATPVAIDYNIKYDFTSAATKAYGNNQSNLGDGNFALISGDVNQNGAINLNDFSAVENSTQLFLTGYLPGDLTGDGLIESSDYSIVENNIGRVLMRP